MLVPRNEFVRKFVNVEVNKNETLGDNSIGCDDAGSKWLRCFGG
jgi:hypothetical protein